ncbi:MAG: hypothetical protein HC876_18065 [Chloroflexaceae bacterium]|nr:hypothetical protein [Chloroflexaceae bacterium]NJO07258.1 hypothetical protein [Chloroflexaceae bacterium]NJO84111.1 hypothetical protein [Blastochloris sp.]
MKYQSFSTGGLLASLAEQVLRRLPERKPVMDVIATPGTIIDCKRTLARKQVYARRLLVAACAVLALAFVVHINLGLALLPIFGLLFVLRGTIYSCPVWLALGSVLAGSGLGLLLTIGVLHPTNGDTAGGLFLLTSALGWFSAVLLSRRYTCATQWWPAIPGSMMALTALFLFF